jgi:hypothetical protein
MKKLILILISLCLLTFCTNRNSAEYIAAKEKARLDSILNEIKKSDRIDSMKSQSIKNALFDTLGLSIYSPIQVTSSRFVKKDYSNFKDLEFTFKNISDKKVDGIRFRWYGVTAFGEPADMGGTFDGFGNGEINESINPGKSRTVQWAISSSNGKRIVKVWPYEVAFEDGTKWATGK